MIGGPVYGEHCLVDRVPATLLAALSDLMKWLDATNIPSVVIGGVAASVLGRPRLTQKTCMTLKACSLRIPRP